MAMESILYKLESYVVYFGVKKAKNYVTYFFQKKIHPTPPLPTLKNWIAWVYHV